MIIGLSGYARSGKDEFAKTLVEEFGYKRVAFADTLRDFLYALNPMVAYSPVELKFRNPSDGTTKRLVMPDAEPLRLPVYVRQVIDEFGWDGYKETQYGSEIRGLLQRLGTEAGRNILGDNIWVDTALTGLAPDAKVVVTDCRFPNEAEAITSRGGQVWRITRPGVEPVNPHISEVALDGYAWHRTILNDGTLEDFQWVAKEIGKQYE